MTEQVGHPAAVELPLSVSVSGEQAPETSFEQVYDEHFARLVGVMRLDGASAFVAEEIAQEAFVRTFSRWPRVRLGSNPAGYVYRTAFRLLRRSRASRLIVVDASMLATSADQRAEPTRAIEIIEALRSLPARQRHCLLLTEHAGMTSEEVGVILRIKASTVRVHVTRAKEKLRQALS